ncbi:cullin-associated NEDD8-dissociated protein 1-like isoform X2 [Apium graveolens]|uniref:cullin-associated NEDD8-dissociated protein 1-like isoform X2 n=1 Tax=Apium graveolens TaxID=4045 RepID=UPI003D7BFD9C
MHKCSPPFKDQNAHVASVKNILGSHASYLMSGKELSKIVAFVKGTQFDLLEFLQRERYGSAHLDNFASGRELIGQKACPKLMERFGEREEVVKMDVFNTFIELLRQTGNARKGQNEDGPSPICLLKQEVPKIVKLVQRQLRGISVNTKVAALSLLKELAVVLPECMADNFKILLPEIQNALCDKSSTSALKLEALILTRLVLASNSPTVFYTYIEDISRPILLAVRDSYYKVTAEALRVCDEIVRVVRPKTQGYNFDYKPCIYPIYNAIMECLVNQDQYQEVKECAISSIGFVVCTFGDNLGAELPACLTILANRMGNEITRLAAVKGLLTYCCFSNAPRPILCPRACYRRSDCIFKKG